MKRLAVALLGSMLTAGYWWIAFTIVYADVLFAGDRDPAQPPTADRDEVVGNGIKIAAAVLIYAALVAFWQSLARRLKRAGRR